ncbi:MAG TPA: hypothetical protein GXZ82_02000 [Firmicutes bacterium]|jgi:predicted Zn-ribbon and HTH transcriptional regulator|nr:hypothetical protein [Bacillota bacterium]
MRIGKRHSKSTQSNAAENSGERHTADTLECARPRTCPECGYTLEAMATRCPRCLTALPGWSCSSCSAKSLCHLTR